MGVTKITLRNHLTRSERVARWNAAAQEGRTFRPERIAGKTGVRLHWVRRVTDCAVVELHPDKRRKVPRNGLTATVRLVALAIATHGKRDGTDIYPGVRLLAGQCALSQRATCEAIDVLVRRGYLVREWRRGTAAGAGFRYVLTLPVLTYDQQLGADTRSAAVLMDDQHRVPVLTDGQHRADAGSKGADANSTKVLTHGQPIRVLPEYRSGRTAAPAGLSAGGRAQNGSENPESQRKRRTAAKLAASAAVKPRSSDS